MSKRSPHAYKPQAQREIAAKRGGIVPLTKWFDAADWSCFRHWDDPQPDGGSAF